MYYSDKQLEDIMIDNNLSVEERMRFLLDEADLRRGEDSQVMNTELLFQYVGDISLSYYAQYKDADEIPAKERHLSSRLKNTCQLLEQKLLEEHNSYGNKDYAPYDEQRLRQYWETLSRLDRRGLNN